MEIKAASLESYSNEDREFFKWWYSHMKNDQMIPPLDCVWHSTARYIWDAAKKSKAGD